MKKLGKLIGVIAIGLLLFYGMLLVYGSNIAGVIYNTLFFGKYNTMFISEIALLLFVLVVLIIRKRIGILTFKGKKFWYSVKRGMPILVISLIVLVGNLLGLVGSEVNIPNLCSLIILAITVGMAEEFFFRGFIQNEITDIYGNNRKQVIISVVISGVIFGLVHISNIFSQDVITTLMQVLQASALGILLGSVYFITKNIWAVVFLHGFYDFAIMIGEVNSYKDCINSADVSIIMLIFTLFVSLVYVFIYLVGAYLNLQKRYVNEYVLESVSEEDEIKDRENATKVKKAIVVVVVVLLLGTYLIPLDEAVNRQICYEYESISMKGEITYSLESEFAVGNYRLKIVSNELVVSNIVDNKESKVTLSNKVKDLYVYDDKVILNGGDIIYFGLIDSEGNVKVDEYSLPEIVSIGVIRSNEEVYPLLKSYVSDYFIIKDGQVMVLEED